MRQSDRPATKFAFPTIRIDIALETNYYSRIEIDNRYHSQKKCYKNRMLPSSVGGNSSYDRDE